ncbi:MAG: glycosyltransferase [Clostridia bacterium]|nr:glycosyltransferase [Clostridia bacterium]
MKIIECITDTNIGGAGVLLVNRLSHTDLQKYDITVLLPKGSLLKRKLLPLGVKFIEIKGRGDRSFNIGAFFEYVRIIRSHSPDVINAHSSLTFRIAARLCRVPVRICTRHCAYPVSLRFKIPILRYLFAKIERALTHRYIAVAEAAKENLVEMGVPSERIKVIINGAQALRKISEEEKRFLRNSLDIPLDTTLLVICARLEECKGHKYLLEAMSDESLKAIYLLIMGSGSLEKELKERARALGIDKRVRFLGFIWDIAPYMNIADINVNCSVGTETSCLALSEGMSLSKPAVASDYGGNPYMIKDGENGFLYPMTDVKKLSLAIARLSNDKKLYSVMSEASKKRFDGELNAAEMSRKTYAFYEELLSKDNLP